MVTPKTRTCNGKQVIGIGKIYRCGVDLWDYEKKLCSGCLLRKFKLESFYDDGRGSSFLREDDVIMALRKATKL